ncbi:hypothetical protein KGF57_000222 [Candida theae]|uniref:ubiquitinyl hydrolase 1 n=1 Tax=Candida theae TaxID=1198502 RepID=A0AAD5BJE7_9ASCO|nr:uncharacterized protein KGF57_000222 [Candida theae]KAI5968363.1 hypothetical protein KGF57_000222 [Candida theae]
MSTTRTTSSITTTNPIPSSSLTESASSPPRKSLSKKKNKSSATSAPSNPILDRYLTTPISFYPAKHQENYSSTSSSLPASYIVLSKNNASTSDKRKGMKRKDYNGDATAIQFEKDKKEKVVGVTRPKSLAEAVASYSGNKYESPKQKKRKRKLAELERQEREKKRNLDSDDAEEEDNLEADKNDGDEGEEERDGEELLEQPPAKKPKGLWGSLKSLFGGVANGHEDEDVGEEIVEGDEAKRSPFNPLRKKDFNESSSPSTSADEAYDDNSPFTGFSEPERSETGEEEEEEEEEDPDFDDKDAEEISGESNGSDESDDDEEDVSYEDNEMEDKESSPEGTASAESDVGDGEYVDEDKDVGKLRQDLKVDQLVNGQGKVHTITRRRNEEGEGKVDLEEQEEQEEEETEDGGDALKFFKSSSTPPTSPEDSDAQKCLVHEQYYSINELPSDRGSNGSKRIYKNWRQLANTKPPVGLLNHGVTCYMNSAIQSLVHIPAFQHYLNDIYEGKVANLKPRSVSQVLAELSKRMWSPNKPTAKYINPKKIIQRLDDINCMMSEWQQEDSHEYYMSLMSRLQEDSVPKGHKLNESIIYDIFGGLLHQKITCQQCHNVSSTKQEFYDLSLGLNRKKYQNSCRFTIEKSINEFFSDEVIRKNESDSKSGYYCEQCRDFTQANKISSIITAPETLTIHLKRFKFNGNSSSKVKQGISYSKYLDLTKYMDQESESERDARGEGAKANKSIRSSPSSAKYQLIAVIVHEGRSISSGHYICHVLQPDGVSWSTYDDEYINRIDERRALSDANAYVLVYTKLTPKVDV